MQFDITITVVLIMMKLYSQFKNLHKSGIDFTMNVTDVKSTYLNCLSRENATFY